jgi:hypothetical protein
MLKLSASSSQNPGKESRKTCLAKRAKRWMEHHERDDYKSKMTVYKYEISWQSRSDDKERNAAPKKIENKRLEYFHPMDVTTQGFF